MRVQWKYSYKGAIAIWVQYIISRISLLYFKHVSQRKITMIRKGGIGDAIMSMPSLSEFKNKYPGTNITLITNHPSMFLDGTQIESTFSIRNFPMVWLMYEHYDFALWRKSDRHIKQIIAEQLGLDKASKDLKYVISVNETAHETFLEEKVREKKFIVIQPQASGWYPEKNWTISKWEELVQGLIDMGYMVYQLGIKEDDLIGGVQDMRGRTSIQESLLLIKYARFFFGVNSFGEQVASAFHVPSIILYGPTNPIYSINMNQNAIFSDKMISGNQLSDLKYDFKDMDSISSEFVLEQFKRIESINE